MGRLELGSTGEEEALGRASEAKGGGRGSVNTGRTRRLTRSLLLDRKQSRGGTAARRRRRKGGGDGGSGRRGADAGEEAPGGEGSMGRRRPWTGGGHASVPDREKQERGVSGQERQSEGGGEETGRRLLISDEVGAPARPGGRSNDVRRRGQSGSGGARARA